MGSPGSAGSGTIGFEGVYGTGSLHDSCAWGGSGSGRHFFTIPTESGPRWMETGFTFTYGLSQGEHPMGGHFRGQVFSGAFHIRPVRGDCATAPVTAVVEGEGALSR